MGSSPRAAMIEIGIRALLDENWQRKEGGKMFHWVFASCCSLFFISL
jgi:hypothetical protein